VAVVAGAVAVVAGAVVVVTGAVVVVAGAVAGVLTEPAAEVPSGEATLAPEAVAAPKVQTTAMQISRPMPATRLRDTRAPQRLIDLVGPPAYREWSHLSYPSGFEPSPR
jgi:hypothetical protein